MNNKPTKDKGPKAEDARLLWILAYAQGQMNAALEMIQACTDNSFDDSHPFYNTFISAIVVKYASPFSRNNIGKLPDEYSAFIEPRLKLRHTQLITARNKVYAHTDRENIIPLEMEIVREPTGPRSARFHYKARIQFRTLLSVNLPDIKALCDFQNTRLSNALTDLFPKVVPIRTINDVINKVGTEKVVVKIPYPEKDGALHLSLLGDSHPPDGP